MKKRKVYGVGFLILSLLCGCVRLEKEEAAQEVAYQIVEEDDVPEDMKQTIEQKKAEPFQITYEDEEALYIGQGYGEKDREGYEIEVDLCEESEHFIYIHMILHGPREESEKKDSWPYLIVRLDRKEKQVIFLNELGG